MNIKIFDVARHKIDQKLTIIRPVRKGQKVRNYRLLARIFNHPWLIEYKA